MRAHLLFMPHELVLGVIHREINTYSQYGEWATPDIQCFKSGRLGADQVWRGRRLGGALFKWISRFSQYVLTVRIVKDLGPDASSANRVRGRRGPSEAPGLHSRLGWPEAEGHEPTGGLGAVTGSRGQDDGRKKLRRRQDPLNGPDADAKLRGDLLHAHAGGA